MHHIAHVRFVNAHAKGHRGYNDIDFVIEKLALNKLSLVAIHPCVIGRTSKALSE